MKPTEFTTFEVVTVSVRKNVLNYHLDGEAYGFDLAEIKVESPGPLLNTMLPIAIPQTGTKSYNEAVAALPIREKMWEALRLPARKLVIQVRQTDVNRYLETRGDSSRMLPSVDALSLKSVEVKSK